MAVAKNIFLGITSGACLAAVVVWRVIAAQHGSVVHIVDVHDISRSHFQGCGVFEALARDAVQSPGLSAKSTLTILVTGDKGTANEPIEIAQYRDLKSSRAIEGKNADEERLEAMLQDVKRRCTALAPTSRSPILLAVHQALDILHAEGCKGETRCVLNVDSDGQENADRSLQMDLVTPNAHHAPTIAKMDNNGVDVRFCGFASTAGRLLDMETGEIRSITRNTSGDDRLRQAWTGLFVNQSQIAFSAFCPK